jgi:O-antigen/teichoic acid export membrane protein
MKSENHAKDSQDDSLTNRAAKTMVNAMLVNVVQFFVNFFITPVIITTLGAELYGAWQMILQAVQYLARGDLRPMGTLRILLAVRQHDNDIHEKQRLIGAALLLTFGMLPLVLFAGYFLVIYSPSFIRVAVASQGAVQTALAISILCIAVDKLIGIPGSVLSGMNLEYKAMGLTAIALFVSAILSLIAVKTGLGLPGLAAAALAGVVILGGTRFLVARHFISWFAAALPRREEVKFFLGKSGWYFGSSISDALLNVSDLLIVGYILGPSAAAIYATTGAVLRFSTAPVMKILNSANAGIGGLCGKGEWDRVIKIRREIHLTAILIYTLIGVGIILLNKQFLSIWVGSDFYGGDILNILLVLIALSTVLMSPNEIIIDNLTLFKEKFTIKLLVGGAVVFVGGFATLYFGMIGFAVSLLTGRICIIFCYSKLVTAHTNLSTKSDSLGTYIRPYTVLFISYLCVYYTPFEMYANTWLKFIFATLITGSVMSFVIWLLSLKTSDKSILSKRFAIVTNVFTKRGGVE